MRRLWSWWCLLAVLSVPAWSMGQEWPRLFRRSCPDQIVVQPCPSYPAAQPAPAAPAQPQMPSPSAAPSTPSAMPPDLFAQAPAQGTAATAGFNPNMIGDFNGYFTCVESKSYSSSYHYDSSYSSSSSSNVRKSCYLPIPQRAAFKIAENESPRPQDRVYFTYNFFSDVARISNPGGDAINMHREVLGFEKSFMDQLFSVGMRVPLVQLEGDDAFRSSRVGDLSFIGKVTLWENRNTGNLISAGLVITAPTDTTFVKADGTNALSTLFQPFYGYIFNLSDRAFLHGFSSISIPTQPDDATLWFVDAGLGYKMYEGSEDAWISAITPTIEAHYTNPLSQEGLFNTPVGAPEIVIVTGGVHVVSFNRSILTFGLATPITGPKVFAWEGALQWNIRF